MCGFDSRIYSLICSTRLRIDGQLQWVKRKSLCVLLLFAIDWVVLGNWICLMLRLLLFWILNLIKWEPCGVLYVMLRITLVHRWLLMILCLRIENQFINFGCAKCERAIPDVFIIVIIEVWQHCLRFRGFRSSGHGLDQGFANICDSSILILDLLVCCLQLTRYWCYWGRVCGDLFLNSVWSGLVISEFIAICITFSIELSRVVCSSMLVVATHVAASTICCARVSVACWRFCEGCLKRVLKFWHAWPNSKQSLHWSGDLVATSTFILKCSV